MRHDVDTITISRFKAPCLAALDRVATTHRPLVVTRRGILIAKVVPADTPERTPPAFGAMAEGTEEVDDILASLPESDCEALV